MVTEIRSLTDGHMITKKNINICFYSVFFSYPSFQEHRVRLVSADVKHFKRKEIDCKIVVEGCE